MRVTIVSALLLFALDLFAQSPSGADRAAQVSRGLVGKTAPRLTLHTIDGTSIDLASLYGHKPIYLKFWATWCQTCREQMRHFEGVQNSVGRDLAVIGIDLGLGDTPRDVSEFRRQFRLTMPLAIDDGSAAVAFNVRVTPMHVVIGRDGRILHVGHLVDEHLAAALEHARRPSAATIAPQNGKPTVLAFVAVWCESYLASTRPNVARQCKTRREELSAAMSKFSTRANWVWIASGLWTEPEDLKAFNDHYKLNNVRLDDRGELFRQFDIHDFPTVIILDADGTTQARISPDGDLRPALENNLLHSPR